MGKARRRRWPLCPPELLILLIVVSTALSSTPKSPGTASCLRVGQACDDGDACTFADECRQDGRCAGMPLRPLLACDDGNDATQDTCDSQTGCIHVRYPSTTNMAEDVCVDDADVEPDADVSLLLAAVAARTLQQQQQQQQHDHLWQGRGERASPADSDRLRNDTSGIDKDEQGSIVNQDDPLVWRGTSIVLMSTVVVTTVLASMFLARLFLVPPREKHAMPDVVMNAEDIVDIMDLARRDNTTAETRRHSNSRRGVAALPGDRIVTFSL